MLVYLALLILFLFETTVVVVGVAERNKKMPRSFNEDLYSIMV